MSIESRKSFGNTIRILNIFERSSHGLSRDSILLNMAIKIGPHHPTKLVDKLEYTDWLAPNAKLA